MKGSSSFSTRDIARIRSLLSAKIRAPRNEQKRLRDEIRALGFYITDIRKRGGAFGPADLDRAISAGEITVHP